ncbi:MAG: HepT-like ribonuclease domain-containing protein [Campylobacter sp.]
MSHSTSYRQLKKLEKVEECHVLEKFKKEDLKGIRGIRNWSSRDYENMQNKIMKEMIHRELPKLKNTQIDNDEKYLYKNLFDTYIKQKAKNDISKNYSLNFKTKSILQQRYKNHKYTSIFVALKLFLIQTIRVQADLK